MTKHENKVIAMICAQYPPNSGPGPKRMAAFAKGLAENGYEPHVFTSEIKPGAIVSNWKKLDDFDQSGDELSGASAGRGRKQHWYEVLLNLFVPMEPNWTLSLANLIQVFKPFAQAKKPSSIFTTSNPLASAVGGALLKRRFKVPLIVEFRDPWTLNPVRNWPTRLHFFAESMLEKWVLRTADAVVMNTPTARTNLLKKYKWLNEEKVHVISHGFDGEISKPRSAQTVNTDEDQPTSVSIAHLGGFYAPAISVSKPGIVGLIKAIAVKLKATVKYNIRTKFEPEPGSTPKALLQAVASYNRSRTNRLPEIKVNFIGGRQSELVHFIKLFELEDVVTISPRVSANNVRSKLQQFDLVYLTNHPVEETPAVSTRSFEYFAARRPVIADLTNSDQARLIDSIGAGWVCSPGDSLGIEKILKNALSNNCRILRSFQPDLHYIGLFARSHQISDLVAIVELVTRRKTGRSIISECYLKMLPRPRAMEI